MNTSVTPITLCGSNNVLPQPYPANLSQQEVRVMQCLADGLSLRATAKELGIARSTAQNHVVKVHEKTGMETTYSAIAWLFRHGVLK